MATGWNELILETETDREERRIKRFKELIDDVTGTINRNTKYLAELKQQFERGEWPK